MLTCYDCKSFEDEGFCLKKRGFTNEDDKACHVFVDAITDINYNHYEPGQVLSKFAEKGIIREMRSPNKLRNTKKVPK